VEYICCEIISAENIATGEAARMSDTKVWTECQDIFNHYAIVLMVDTRLRLPTEILLKGMQL